MRIVVDAMGGDHAPAAVVRGAVAASRNGGADIVLVGDETRLRPLLEEAKADLPVVHTDEWIRMDESPGPGLRSRRRASMVMAARMLREREVEGFVCAGNTAALHQVALTVVGRLSGIRRPALAAVLPTRRTPALVLDVGANAECRPDWLLQFAVMGSIYAEKVLDRENPRVGILNIGSEAGKGSPTVVEASLLLRESGLNFTGNVEPGGFFAGEVDVLVTDGFAGNVFLKTGEAVAEWFMARVHQAARSSVPARLGGQLLKPALRRFLQEHSHSEHGGAILLGLRGVVIKCHGRADARAIEKGVGVAEEVIRQRVVERIAESLSREAAR